MSLQRLVRLCRQVGRALCLILPAAVSMVVAGLAAPDPVQAQQQPAAGPASGLPLPRFVSLKADRVNMRRGPGIEYPTQWVYRRAGLPLEVVKEFEGWRQVRDSEGTTGWVLQSMLSGRRTALVLPWELKAGNPPPMLALRDGESESAAPVARIEAGVIANVGYCNGRWCRVTVGDIKGFIEQAKLWGVYPNESVK